MQAILPTHFQQRPPRKIKIRKQCFRFRPLRKQAIFPAETNQREMQAIFPVETTEKDMQAIFSTILATRKNATEEKDPKVIAISVLISR